MTTLKEAADQFNAALTEAVEGKTGDDRDAVIAEAAASLPPTVGQFKFDEGHRSATGNKSSQIRTLEAERDALQAKLAKAEERAQAAEDAVPDAESIKAPYVAEIADLTAKLDATKSDYEAKIAERDAETFLSGLQAKAAAIASEHGQRYFETELKAMKLDGRIRKTADGFEVMQPGKDIPYAATTPEALQDLVLSEMKGSAPSFALRSDVDAGGGASAGGHASGPATTAVFADVDAKYGGDKAQSSARERLGLN